MNNERYNPSLLMPVIDVIVGIALFAGAAFLWYNTRGQEQVFVAREGLEQIRQEQQNELVARQLEIDERGQSLVDVQNDHEAKKQYVTFLAQRIDVETVAIEDGRDKDRKYTDVLLGLRDDIRKAEDELRANEARVTEEDDRIARRQSEVDSLQAEVLDRERRISELENETAEALAVRRHDPYSIFPTKAGFLAAYELNDEADRFVAGLSHDVFDLQNLRFGLQGVVGLSSEENTSLKEGGLYLNIPLIFRRASIEVGAGLSGTRVGAQSTQYDPYVSGHFRLAPLRRERLFLLGGPHLTGETVGFRLGLGIGRR
jgi:hypothetical protein